MQSDITSHNDFEGVLDIQQARNEKYNPLPLKADDSGENVEKKYEFEDVAVAFDDKINTSHNYVEIETDSTKNPQQDRLDRWRNKLLDLSKKNRLINFREGAKVVPLVLHDIARLEDYLSQGKTFSIHPQTKIISGTDSRDHANLSKKIQDDSTSSYLEDELKNSRIYSSYEEKTLGSKLLAIYRQARIDIEEGGCNTLHIALGFLEWCEKEDINKSHYKAPILLVPVKLERKSVSEGFTLSRTDEDIVLNITLLEMLKHDFNKQIVGIDPDDLPKDDSGVDVKKILLKFQNAILDTPGWEVKREAWLGCFSFQKILMYNDLKNRTEDLLKNPVVDHILNHPKEFFNDNIDIVRESDIDESIKSGDLFCPLSADSSQISAVLSAEKGKNFILIGPPGTGKSQTITNIIAHCLAKKKKVLFVSEKKAALEVVYHRLQKIGLAPFCLELHSNKVGKTEVMKQFKEMLDYKVSQNDRKWESVTKDLDCLRYELRDYVEAIHKKYPNGFSPYQAFSFLIAHNDKKEKIPYLNFRVMPLSTENIQDIRNCAKELEDYSQMFSVEHSVEHWKKFGCIKKDSWNPSWEDDVHSSCSEMIPVIESLITQEKAFAKLLGINAVDAQQALFFPVIVELANSIKEAVLLPQGLYCDDWEQVYPILQEFIEATDKRDVVINSLNDLNFEQLINESGERNIFSDAPQTLSHCFCFAKSEPIFQPFTSNEPWSKNLSDLVQKHLANVQTFRSAVKNARYHLGLEHGEFNETTANRLLALWRLISESPCIPQTFFCADSDFLTEALDLCNTGKNYEETATRLLEHNFNLDKIRGLDASNLLNKFERNKDASNFFKRFSLSRILRKIRKTLIDKSLEITPQNAGEYLNLFVEYVEAYKKIKSVSPSLIKIINTTWKYEKTDWEELNHLLTFFQKLKSAVCSLVEEDTTTMSIAMKKLKTLIVTQDTDSKKRCKSIADTLLSSCTNYEESLNDILKLFRNNWEKENIAGKLSDLFTMPTAKVQYADVITVKHCDFIESITSLSKSNSEINKILSSLNLSSRLRDMWRNGKFDKAVWKNIYDTIETIETVIEKNVVEGLKSQLRKKLGENLSSRDNLERIKSEGRKLVEKWKGYKSETRIITIEKNLEAKLERKDVVCVQQTLDFIIENLKMLKPWCNWQATCKKAKNLQLEIFVEMATSPDKICSIPLAVEIAMFKTFINEVYNESKTLSNFLGDIHNKHIERFQELDDSYTELSCQMVRYLVSSDLPGENPRNDAIPPEFGNFRRVVSHQGGIMSVRKLLSKFSSIALRLKPCMLMSPLSVAQYLPPGQSDFDLVIFDEASQITPWDALGAIARGRQLIVVGDPQQLPPTSFFQREDDDSDLEDDENVPDEKSILDECIAANIAKLSLKWHYRSRHENLIAFSNYHYYDNKLLTFPAARNDSPPLGVTFHFVKDGVYSQKSNRVEAQALIDEVVKTLQSPYFKEHLSSPEEAKSLGIITFNQTQQELIENLLENARKEHPDIEPFFQPDYFEPVFVKNIENVQGDERDFIFFSICFAKPEKSGRVSMNFGPLNKDGGERRLNVAITRAKERIFVFSSIHYDELDLTKTAKIGPARLKNFLEYAEKRFDVLGREITAAHTYEYDSPFEEEVAKFLRDNEYEIHTQVGTSGYRIDLAVVSKVRPGRYALGIECDGASYHSAATVRDRDKLRQHILEGKGWNIIRVWSTDWWHDPDKTKDNLLKSVADYIEKDSRIKNEVQEDIVQPIFELESPEIIEEKKTRNEENHLAVCEKAQPYPSLDYLRAMPISKELSQNDFYAPEKNKILQEQIQTILEQEAPITEELLITRMAKDIWNFQREGDSIRVRLKKLFSQQYSTCSKAGNVYWLHEDQCKNYQNFRLSTENRKKLEDIPVEELKNAMTFLISEYGKFDNPDELFKLTGKKFGFNRLTNQAREYYQIAFDFLNKS